MKTLTIENYKELSPFIKKAAYTEYNSNIVTMLMWTNMYEVSFEVFDQFAIVFTKMKNEDPIWFMPYCEPQYRKQAIDKMHSYSCEHHFSFELDSMTTEFKNWLMITYQDKFIVWDYYDAQDYIYERAQQEHLSGKKMQKRRNHYNAFLKQYAGRFEYRVLHSEHTSEIYEFLAFWQSQKGEHEQIGVEDTGIRLLLSHMDELPLLCGGMYIDDKLEAFTIASMLSADTIQIHVEKANRTIRGLYIAIVKQFLASLDPTIQYVNREDDMGLPTLRKAKNDMHPLYKIKKFGCRYQPLSIQRANDVYLPQIQALWEENFKEETIQTTQYYFDYLYKKEDCYIVVSNQELIGMLQLRDMELMLCDKPTTIPLIVGVATNKKYEGCGYMKRLLTYALDIVSKQAPYMLLQAYNWDIYKPFGFEELYKKHVTKLDTHFYTMPSGDLVETVDATSLAALYTQYTMDKQGYRIRNADYYNTYLPYKQVWGCHVFVHILNGISQGYMYIEEETDCTNILECIYTDQTQLTAMLSLLCANYKQPIVHCDAHTTLQGETTLQTSMMVLQHHADPFPKKQLFINEEL